jgi:hypothetical protein
MAKTPSAIGHPTGIKRLIFGDKRLAETTDLQHL